LIKSVLELKYENQLCIDLSALKSWLANLLFLEEMT